MLDFLASRFIADGWSFKKMHKLIMLSAAYQQSSDANLTYAQKDPDNRLVWRANLRRLDFEAVRDTMLMFTGKLDLTVGGTKYFSIDGGKTALSGTPSPPEASMAMAIRHRTGRIQRAARSATGSWTRPSATSRPAR